jgi:hypothetical protein
VRRADASGAGRGSHSGDSGGLIVVILMRAKRPTFVILMRAKRPTLVILMRAKRA